MTGLLRKLTKVVVYTAVPLSGPVKALTVGTRASAERSKAQLAELREQTEILRGAETYSAPIVRQVDGETRDEAKLRWAIANEPDARRTRKLAAKVAAAREDRS